MMPAMVDSSPPSERRRAVRLRPIPELPARVALLDLPDAVAEIVDVAVGGFAIAQHPSLEALAPSTSHRVKIDLGRYGTFEGIAEVRHRGGGLARTIGMALAFPDKALTTALGRYVAELLERGATS